MVASTLCSWTVPAALLGVLVVEALAQVGARQVRVIDMAQGNKVSRILAWSFLDEASRIAWWSAPGR